MSPSQELQIGSEPGVGAGGFASSDPAFALEARRHGEAPPAARLMAAVLRFLRGRGVTRVEPIAARLGDGWADLTLALRPGDLERATWLAGVLGRRLGGTSRGDARPPGELVVTLNGGDTANLPAPDAEPPCLVPLATSQGRGVLHAAWDALDNVLIAGDERDAVEATLTNLVAWLVALLPPDRLRVRAVAPSASALARVAAPRLVAHADPSDDEDVRRVLVEAAAEVRRRWDAGPSPGVHPTELVVLDGADLSLPTPEFAYLSTHACAAGVRLVAGTTDPVSLSGLTLGCFATRLVLRVGDAAEGERLVQEEDLDCLLPGALALRLGGRPAGTGTGFAVPEVALARLLELARAGSDRTASADAPSGVRAAGTAGGPTEQIAAGSDAAPSAGAPVDVACFGSPRVLCRGRELWPGRGEGRLKHWELLLYLAVRSETTVAKDEVLEALWPDAPDTNGLRTAMNRLRTELRAAAAAPDAEVVHSTRWGCAIDRAFVASDAHRFASLCRSAIEGAPDAAMEAARAARALYAGPLLGDRAFAWLDEPTRSGVTPADDYRTMHRRVTERLADLYLGGGRPALAAPLYRELLVDDPTHERTVRKLVRCLHRLGDRPGLAREEHRLRAALRERFVGDGPTQAVASEPEAKTAALFRELLGSAGTDAAG